MMPLFARSVRRFLVPVILGLSPLAASAASDVTILRDEWGIPQVYADDVYGLYAGFGYAVAEDRLFQMEMARRSVLGTVSEVLGAEHVAYDTQTRANFDQSKIRAQIEALPPEQRDILRGYAAGYNKRLAEVMADKANASAAGIRRVRLRAEPMDRVRRRDDLRRHHGGPVLALLERAQQREGARRADRPARRGAGPTDLRPDLLDRGSAGADDRACGRAVPEKGGSAGAGRRHPLRGALDPADPGREDDRPRASNVWILGPKKTTDGSTILVNGPQFGNFNPAYVFSIGLHGAGFDITGNTPFAVPNILFGTNGTIAWGATAGPLDVNDYVQLELNPENPHQYRHGRRLDRHAAPPGNDQGQGRGRRHRRRLGVRLRRGQRLRRRA